jgi:hypothetical protein
VILLQALSGISAVSTDSGMAPDSVMSIVSAVNGWIKAGGSIVAVELVLSVFLLTLVLLKLWQFQCAGLFSVHHHRLSCDALVLW